MCSITPSSFQISMNATPTMVVVVTSVPTHKDPPCVAADQDTNLLQMLPIVLVRIIVYRVLLSKRPCVRFKFTAKKQGRAPHK